MNTDKVTRVEVIDANGRSYTNHLVKDVTFSLQDDDRTLKIFIKDEYIELENWLANPRNFGPDYDE